MGKAWGHHVRKLTDAEIQKQEYIGQSWYKFKQDHPSTSFTLSENDCIQSERKCRISKTCQNQSAYLLTYQYVTGRRGRVTFAEKPICEHHAKKYQTEEDTIRDHNEVEASAISINQLNNN